jgi:MoaA/NifB/PqqE/SkfB family radical SAM enzyme
MISRIYNILPKFFKEISVEIHRDIRLLLFGIFKSKQFNKLNEQDRNSYINFNKSRRYGPMKHICYAPYTSMFFSRSGLISPCYASYNESSSKISESSLTDIWVNGSFAKIRAEHQNGDLEKTCKFCKTIIDSQSFGSLLINKYEHYAFSKSKYPAIMEFELSNKCNLACIMCDSNLSSAHQDCNSENNLYYGERFFEELKEFIPHLQVAEFTGGDPFMIEEYYKIWDMIHELNPKCQILITTNANTMNPRIEKLLEDHKNIHFNVSIDSLQKENYEAIRKNGNFDFAMKNLDKFIEFSRKNKTSLNILVCPMTINRHELGDFVNFANEKNICVYYHTVLKPRELSLKYFDKHELQKTIEKLESINFQFTNSTTTTKGKTNAENFNNLIILLKNWSHEDVITEAENKATILLSAYDAELKLKKKIGNQHPKLIVKFEQLLNLLKAQKDIQAILNRLLNIEETKFFSYLEEKSVEELKYICISITEIKSDKPKD